MPQPRKTFQQLVISMTLGALVTMATYKKTTHGNALVFILIQSSENEAHGISQRQVVLLLSASARLEAY